MHGPVFSVLLHYRSASCTAAGARPSPGEQLAHAVAAGRPSRSGDSASLPSRSLISPRGNGCLNVPPFYGRECPCVVQVWMDLALLLCSSVHAYLGCFHSISKSLT